MTVLVTGGSGLVGSHVIAALRAQGTPVRALARASARRGLEPLGVEVIEGDVVDPNSWRRAAAGVHAIVHAAAIVQRPGTPWADYEAINVGGTRNAVQAARAAGARLIHVSSVAVYGGSASFSPQPEQRTEEYPFHTIAEDDFYARSKRLAEQAVQDAAAAGTITAVAIRPNVIYGEHDRLFMPRIIRAARWRVLPRFGAGTNHLSCVYAGNVAVAIVAAIAVPRSGFRAYNVTADAPPALTAREFFEALGAALGRRLWQIPIPPAAALRIAGLVAGGSLARAAVSFATGDNPYVTERARRELQWTPHVGSRDALARTVRWFLDRKNERPG